MTPKEKAFELITKFQHPMSEMSDTDCLHISVAKEFSLIAVDEIIDSEPQYEWSNDYWKNPNDFWQEVKQEIQNL